MGMAAAISGGGLYLSGHQSISQYRISKLYAPRQYRRNGKPMAQ